MLIKGLADLKERIAELQAQVGDKEKAITMALQLDEVWYNRARQLEDPAMYYNYVVVEYWTKETERSNEKGRKLKSEMTPMATIRVMRMPKDRIVKQNTEADKAEDQKNGYVVQDFSYPKVKEGEAPKLSFVEMHTTPDAPDMMPFLNEEGMKLFAGIAYFCNAHGNARYEKSAEIANPTPAVVAAKIAETLKANKDAELVCLDERKVAKRYL
jgi:hypothetical protein